jgi:rhodanese-related sulfurtransferase
MAMALVNTWLRWKFSEVPRLSPAALEAWLNDRNRVAPLLLDVRSYAEHDTSFIGESRWTEPSSGLENIEALKTELARAPRPIVVYCSAGYRSAQLARRLLAAGVAPVYNLEGSIFAWANEGRALRSPYGATQWVHPYNAVFGLLLAKAHRARVKRELR